MSSIVIAGDTSGSITLAAPAVAGTNTLTLPANTGTIITTASSGQVIPKAALPTGSVLQVVNATYATAVTSSTDTFVDTGLTASITPTSATSKILVLVSQNGLSKSSANSTNCIDINLLRGATNLLIPTAIGAILETNTTLLNSGAASIAYLDSPATTSSVTYKTQFRSRNNAASVSVQVSNISHSTITLMEIAA